LDILIQELSGRVENLRHLSLHGNPVCPDQLSNDLAEEKDYQLYRCHILFHLRNIRFLDHRPVPLAELKESRKLIYDKVKILPSFTPLPSSNHLYSYTLSSSLPSTIPSSSSSSSSSRVVDAVSLGVGRRKGTEKLSQSHNTNILHESNMEARLSSISISNNNHNHSNQNNNQNSNPNGHRSKGRTGKRRFRYVGKNSEGNRFIQDADL